MPALSGSDAAALVTLRNYAEGEPLELLRRALALSQPGVVRLADRLQARGLVERHRSARDGRAVGLRLTRGGPRRRRRRPRRPRRGHRRRARHARRRPAARPGPHARAHARRPDDRRHRQPRHLPDVRPRRLRPSRALPGDAGRDRPRVASVRLRGSPWTSGATTASPSRSRRPTGSRSTKYARLRARLEADGIARPDEIHECEPVPWDVDRGRAGARAGRAPARRHAVGARAARARAAVVGGARRARAAHDRGHRRRRAPRPGARRRHEPRRRHAPRRLRLRPRLLPVQRRGRRAGPRARRRRRRAAGARSWSTATSTRATGPRRSSPPTPRRSRCPCTARATTRSSASRPTSTSTCRPGPATATTCSPSTSALDAALPRARPDIAFYLAGADPFEGDRLGRLALTKAGLRARDELVVERLRRRGRRRRRRPRRRLRPRRRRHRRHQRRDCGRRGRGRRWVTPPGPRPRPSWPPPTLGDPAGRGPRRPPRTPVAKAPRARTPRGPAGREPLRLVSGKRTQPDAVHRRRAQRGAGEATLPR